MRNVVFVAAACAAVLTSVPEAIAQSGVERVAYDYSVMYDSLNPSIVKIHADSGTGSGFVVDSRGMVATNHHVVRNAR